LPRARLWSLALWLPLALWGCSSAADRAQRYAQRGGLASAIIQGTRFRHQIFVSRGAATDILYVFIEGDGSPWTHAGMQVARDPTPARPLALELAVRTRRSVLYLGRPCYFHARADAACTADTWTSGRYSAQVVASMAAAVNQYAASADYHELILIGYSGGGALAVLMAPLVPATRAVMTIAADLDQAAWARWHGFLPLADSLNPALQPPLPPAILQWHLVGGRDANVPEALNQRYFDGSSGSQVWRYPTYDHSCCWVEQWPRILARLETQLRD
jgi:hypothetical protein